MHFQLMMADAMAEVMSKPEPATPDTPSEVTEQQSTSEFMDGSSDGFGSAPLGATSCPARSQDRKPAAQGLVNRTIKIPDSQLSDSAQLSPFQRLAGRMRGRFSAGRDSAMCTSPAGSLARGGSGASCDDIAHGFGESCSEPRQTLYTKDSVWVWPSKSAQRIMGRLALTLKGGEVFISWLPYSSGSVNEDGTFQASPRHEGNTTASAATPRVRTQYAIRATPVSDVEAVRRHAPPIGGHYIVLIMRGGAVHPPLYFHNGGIKVFLNALREHVRLIKTASDPNTYLVSTDSGPLTPQLSMDCGDMHMSSSCPPPMKEMSIARSGSVESVLGHERICVFQRPKEESDSSNNSIRQSLRESFGHAVTAAKAVQKILFPDSSFKSVQEEQQEGSTNTACETLLTSGPLLRARRQRALAINMGMSSNVSSTSLGGSSAEGGENTDVGMFEMVQQAGPATSRHRGSVPLGREEWAGFLDEAGRVVDSQALLKRVYMGGVEPELRREVWKFLLGVYPMESTAAEREAIMDDLRVQYATYKGQWKCITKQQAAHWSRWRERRSQVEKDVHRTDRTCAALKDPNSPALSMMHDILLTYCMFNHDLGYSQGMSDMLTPILLVAPDETEAFWLFVHLMDRVGGNFDKDQTCCQLQLSGLCRLLQLLDPSLHKTIMDASCGDMLFCFRWIVVQLKREWPLEQVPMLWEAIWANPFTPQMMLYVALAMLETQRAEFLKPDLHQGSAHMICSEIRGKIDVSLTLADAEALYVYAGEAGVGCLQDVPLPTLC